METNQKTKT